MRLFAHIFTEEVLQLLGAEIFVSMRSEHMIAMNARLRRFPLIGAAE